MAISVALAPRRMIAAQLATAKAPIAIGSSAATTLRKKRSVSTRAIGTATISAEVTSACAMSWASLEAATCPPIATSIGGSTCRSKGSMRGSVRSFSASSPASERMTSVSWPSREARLSCAVS
jgi:hypothetical protein